jgi:hypothetical protein
MRIYRITIDGWPIRLEAESVQQAITEALDVYTRDHRVTDSGIEIYVAPEPWQEPSGSETVVA